MTETHEMTELSDGELVERTRAGTERAFAELWRRHYRAGVRVAHQFTSLDADDVVSEAFTRIYKTIRAGGGPTGAFRPYLYTSIRNIASTWGAASHDIAVDDFTVFEDPATLADPVTVALDRTLTARAFRSLPERWQTVLWYTEVEGMDPHEVAPILGMSANGVAALSYRAREGLRKAWLQAHISDATAAGECKWALARLGDHARHSLSQRDSDRMVLHLGSCAHCAIISEEVDEVGSRLASVLMPLVLGGAVGGALLASLGSGGGAVAAATIPPAPDLPLVDLGGVGAVGAGAASVGAASVGAGFVGTLSAPVAVVGSLALAAALAGTAAIVVTPEHAPAPAVVAEQELPGAPFGGPTGAATSSPSSVPGEQSTPGVNSGVGDPADPTNLPTPGATLGRVVDELGGVTEEVTTDVEDVTESLVDTITGDPVPPEGHTAPGGVVGADIDLNLVGTATPGAHLSLQAAGQVYATTTVNADGTFVLTATAIPGGLASLEVVQAVDRTYLASLLPGGGAVARVLGTLDGLVQALVQPISLATTNTPVTIVLLN